MIKLASPIDSGGSRLDNLASKTGIRPLVDRMAALCPSRCGFGRATKGVRACYSQVINVRFQRTGIAS
jgi:hypothetical protein